MSKTKSTRKPTPRKLLAVWPPNYADAVLLKPNAIPPQVGHAAAVVWDDDDPELVILIAKVKGCREWEVLRPWVRVSDLRTDTVDASQIVAVSPDPLDLYNAFDPA